MIRVVAQHAPNLFAILGLTDDPTPEEPLPISIELDEIGTRATYYRAETHARWVLYKAALSGWGAAAPNPGDARPVFDPGQR